MSIRLFSAAQHPSLRAPLVRNGNGLSARLQYREVEDLVPPPPPLVHIELGLEDRTRVSDHAGRFQGDPHRSSANETSPIPGGYSR